MASAARRIAEDPDITAVFTNHDLIASSLLTAFRRLGVRVPEELSVVGFDDGPFTEALGLTTVHQPFEESGRVAADLLVERMTDDDLPVRKIELGVELVVRESTAPPLRTRE